MIMLSNNMHPKYKMFNVWWGIASSKQTVLYNALGYLPELAVIHEAYDIPAVPDSVKKPQKVKLR